MTYITPLRSAVCIAALFVGGAAQADVTAAQVWEDWKSQMGLYGENGVTIGAEEQSGDTLTVRDLALEMDDGETSFAASMGDITLTEQGDGTVSVTMAESYPLVITGDDGVVVTLQVSQSNLEMIVSGDPEAMNYAISADRYGIELVDVVDGDVTFTGDASLMANDMSGTYTTTGDELRNLTYDMDIASLDFLVDVQIPGADGEYITASGKYDNMSMQADMAMPMDVDYDNPEDMFAKGFSVEGGYSIESTAAVFDINADGSQVAGSASTGPANLEGVFNSQTVGYDTTVSDLAVSLTTSDLPFPVDISMAEYGIGFQMPVGKSEEVSDLGLNINLIDLAVNDMIWDMFDPGSVLPRDPATIQLGIAGKGKALFDMLDPEQAAAMNNADMPFELESMSLETLRVALAGALMTGTGEFTFDNTDLETFDGMPRPEGDAIVEVSGLNKLMDNLVAMGLVPEDQIMGGRMMLGMFARTTGDDQLETKIEVNGEGHVLVNGQRMR